MNDEINMTGALSPHDYATVLGRLTDARLLEESETNQWLMGHIQMSPIDFKHRYFSCQSEIHARLQAKRMLDNAPTL